MTKETLETLYLEEGLSMKQIAEKLNVSVGKVFNCIHKYGIPAREQHQGFKGKHHTELTKNIISKANSGRVFSTETQKKMSDSAKKGGIGHKKKRKDGYIKIYFPDHPKSSKDGYIMEHILVMECLIGRHLKENEVVHHINKKRDDNRKENLQLMTFKEHAAFHMKERYSKKKGE